jgi:hypothetical protein
MSRSDIADPTMKSLGQVVPLQMYSSPSFLQEQPLRVSRLEEAGLGSATARLEKRVMIVKIEYFMIGTGDGLRF